MSTPGFSSLSRPTVPYGAAELVADLPPTADVGTVPDLRRPVDPQVFVNAYTRPLPTYADTFSGPGYESKPLPTSGFAVAALVCGLVGVFLAVPALAAIGLGHAGLYQTSKNTHLGRGMAIGGLVLGYGVVGLVGLISLSIWVAGR